MMNQFELDRLNIRHGFLAGLPHEGGSYAHGLEVGRRMLDAALTIQREGYAAARAYYARVHGKKWQDRFARRAVAGLKRTNLLGLKDTSVKAVASTAAAAKKRVEAKRAIRRALARLSGKEG